MSNQSDKLKYLLAGCPKCDVDHSDHSCLIPQVKELVLDLIHTSKSKKDLIQRVKDL